MTSPLSSPSTRDVPTAARPVCAGQRAAPGEAVLLTPGPLTTHADTRLAMQRDWGSWDEDFIGLTRRVLARLLDVARTPASDFACVPLQGSGTFAVEAAIGTLVPRDGGLLVLANGAYGRRMHALARRAGRHSRLVESPDDRAIDPGDLASILATDPSLTHVGVIQVETTAGVLNPVDEIADTAARYGRRLIVDAMSGFGALPCPVDRWETLDALVASPNKCLESVPGMAFVIARQTALEAAGGRCHSLSLDLEDQWRYLRLTGQWRYTPPTHVLAALASALERFDAEGGAPARLQRYRANCATLIAGASALGLETFVRPQDQAPVIVTFHAPRHPAYSFDRFYSAVKSRGFILYPGKLTHAETFRVGCIGAIDAATMVRATGAIGAALTELEIDHPSREPTP